MQIADLSLAPSLTHTYTHIHTRLCLYPYIGIGMKHESEGVSLAECTGFRSVAWLVRFHSQVLQYPAVVDVRAIILASTVGTLASHLHQHVVDHTALLLGTMLAMSTASNTSRRLLRKTWTLTA